METDSNQTVSVEKSPAYSLLSKLLFPTVCLALAVVYAYETTDMTIRSLRYPYFVIGLMSVLIVTVYAEEILSVVRAEQTATFAESVRTFYAKWQRSLFVAVATVGYLYLVQYLGFILSSFVVMISLMYASGERDPKTVFGITLAVLAAIYLVFIIVIGLDLPEGPLGLA